MALQSSGAISLANIQTEFGGSNPISISEYYGVGTVPSSGTISFSHFYGQSAYSGPASPVTYTSSTTLTAGTHFPADTNVTFCLTGGGGSGATDVGGLYADPRNTGGGRSGVVSTTVINVSSGTNLTLTIGGGGASVAAKSSLGNAGAASSISGYLTCNGGAGGNYTSYLGNGGTRVTCGGSNTHGLRDTYGIRGYGGESSGFGKGGNGDMTYATSAYGQAGGVGSGGGGACESTYQYTCYSGAGGRGELKVSWS